MPVGSSGVSNFAYSAGVAAGVSAVNRMGSAGVRADFTSEPVIWILTDGTWDDTGGWVDSAEWNDGA